ncbi:hypothetical protein D9V30_10300 [Mycetocola reblochoni]|uniref:Uncharacterized protein n=1 Tax=Mycetocola reblochoni TaxID=331618 RepID=A0A3L6ZLH1_9MICO|nr:hypothetical protein [Mycetocola reblochoni]RLP68371.1 hypothetical protein D9V30_10300 [Mycetocola reblochoni]
MSGWWVGVGDDAELVARHVPGRDNPYLGIQEGNTFVAVAEFISDADMDYLKAKLAGVFFMPAALNEGNTDD